ncbi:MAG TPA: bacterioferritin [Spirochaetota bacterium]|nr:bacterioferritin [Spirochaetota bacterium]OPZ39549.1 MAG: Bacterioferritin [Spirochaetes bacterium ADurb.BinA120]HNU91113.1 bacterioferritin [Spirochaetota bacterium]HPI13248.1 bacterioferritin [Spirochaetota bacterium]HPV96860.1 bacterioferritin [Spirochaetota bacterium]
MAQASREERKKKVVEVLNQARAMELQAIYQYMNQHYNLDNMDYGDLAKNIKLIAIDEMRHAEDFAERIKELGGEPTSDMSGPVEKGQPVEKIYPADSKAEEDAIEAYNQFLRICMENGDSITAKLFETIIDEEQKHLNYFDNVNDHLKRLGPAYLAKIAGTSASTGPASKGFVIGGGA